METERSQNFNLNGLSEKEIKNLEIFDIIRKKGHISRTDISKDTGINMVSVSNYIKNFIDRKLVLERGQDISTGGRRPELIELNTDGNYIIGLDINKTVVRGTLVNLGICVVEKSDVALSRPGEELSEKTKSLIESLIKRAKIETDKVKAIALGIGSAGLAGVTDEIKKHFKIETFAAHSSMCAAFGERMLNPEVDAKSFLYIYSDVGYGVLIKENKCFCGTGGKLSSEDSELSEKTKYLKPWSPILGMTEPAKNEVERGVGTGIVELAKAKIDGITKEVVMAAAMEGDEVAANIVRSVGINLGIRIAYLINMFAPEAVVLGGGVEDSKGLVLDNVEKIVKELALVKEMQHVKIRPAMLGKDAVSLGASYLGAREIFLRA